ncbi:hypothetical protein PHJA_002948400 [Phtheirospermum japonicum]|uniref:Uncharacterized protein n=1 Tax=Phtheirospermum japonicum TaxID=374723 RepID=A0A830DKN4_9LAMI|nr:hypothetical protein PHJA_002948400 [Phtheirospermum japonicum]
MALPVSKFVEHLGGKAKVEGKEAKRMVHKRVFGNFALALYVYVGLTRFVIFVMRTVTSYNFWFLTIVLEMAIELALQVKGWHMKACLLKKKSVGIVFGFFIGVSIRTLPLAKINITSFVLQDSANIGNKSNANENQIVKDNRKIWIPTNPRGAERLPSGIVASESDLYLRRLWGLPREDLASEPKYLVTFTVGYDQRHNIDKAVKKFSDNFTILLFHYDGRTTEWDGFEWSKRAIHISARKQTKWWYAKRFFHPDIVAAYDYIFIWDEDLGVDHFDAEEEKKIMGKLHGKRYVF